MVHFSVSPSGSSDECDGAGPVGKVDTRVDAEDAHMSGGGKESILIGGHVSEDCSIQDAVHQKEAGNKCMGEKDLPGAEAAYGKGLDIVTMLRERAMRVDGVAADAIDVAARDLNETEAILRSNLSLVLIKLERYDEAERHCSVALELEPNQWKVHYRRAKARESCEMPDLLGAEADLTKCIEILTTESSDGKGSIKAKALPSTLADARSSLERVRMSIEEKGKTVLRDVSPSDVPMAIGQPSDDETSSSEGSLLCDNPSPKEQRTTVLRLLADFEGSNNGDVASLRPRSAHIGEAFMLVDMKWWKAWCRHVDFFRDAELKEAIRAENDPSATESNRQRAKSAKTSALRGRLAAAQLLPPGAYLSPMPLLKDVENEKEGKAKRRSSTASSSSSSSEESGEDDGWLNIEGAFGPLPGSIDNSLLILKTDGKAGTKDAHDDFFTEWCRPSQDRSSIDEDGHHFVRLRPNLVRGHHYEVLPRECYGALACWYGDVTPPISRRATASHDDSGGDMVRILLYPELQYNDTGGLSSTWSDNCAGKKSALTAASMPYRCGACKSPGASAQCTRCLSVRYCRKECQINHWPYHKSMCKAISAAGADSHGVDFSSSPSEWGRIGLNNLGNTVSYDPLHIGTRFKRFLCCVAFSLPRSHIICNFYPTYLLSYYAITRSAS